LLIANQIRTRLIGSRSPCQGFAMLPSHADEPLLDFATIVTSASARGDVQKMVLRYSDAILAYASRLLPTREDAENVHLIIVQKMLENRFTKVPVKEGRFRFYVKRAVRHAVYNYQRQRFREQTFLRRFWNSIYRHRDALGKATEEPVAPPAEASLEEAELSIWRATVLNRAMEAALKELEDYQRQHQDRTQPNVYHTLARLLIDHPEDHSDQWAQRLSEQVAGEFNAGQIRGIIMRMRRKLAELLIAEVSQQLDQPIYDNVLAELSDLGLLAFIEPFLPARECPTEKAVLKKSGQDNRR
jgi:hypothetical protein